MLKIEKYLFRGPKIPLKNPFRTQNEAKIQKNPLQNRLEF